MPTITTEAGRVPDRTERSWRKWRSGLAGALGTRRQLEDLGAAELEDAACHLWDRARELRRAGGYREAERHEAWARVCAAELARRDARWDDAPRARGSA